MTPTPDELLDLPLDRFLSEAIGVRSDDAHLEEVAYTSGSPATGGLHRLRGTDADGGPWSLFVKVLQHVRHWPLLHLMPPPIARDFADTFPWRDELLLWSDLTQATLPDGLRSPVLHRVVDLGDDRLAVWSEDVHQAPTAWDLDRYERAAYLLGRWNARSCAPEVVGASPFPPGFGLRMYAEKALTFRGLGALADDGLWRHPWLAPHADLRDELRGLGARIPAMLDRLDSCTQTMGHGDASPQNLLVPAEAPEAFVTIDISFTTPHALGFDLGQLLVGLTHAGEMPAAMLPAIAERILPAYVDGLGAEGVAAEDVSAAFATSVLLRSGFDAIPWEWLDDPEREHDVAERAELTRFLVEQYARSSGEW